MTKPFFILPAINQAQCQVVQTLIWTQRLHRLCQMKIQAAHGIQVMRDEIHGDAIVDVEPFRMVVNLVS